MDDDTLDSMLGETLAYVEQGLVCVEDNDNENAATMLQSAEALLAEAEKRPDAKHSPLYGMATSALRKLRASFEASGGVLKATVAPLRADVPAPSAPPAYSETDPSAAHNSLDAQMLYWLPSGVQLVTIEKGVTASPSPPSALSIFVVEKPTKKSSLYPSLEEAGNPDAIIVVGPWCYPLNPKTSAILKNELGVYVVPNPTDEHSDMYVGIILPQDIEPKLKDEFEEVLGMYATVRASQVAAEMSKELKQRSSERIGVFLLQSGQRFAEGVKTAAERSQAYMNERGTKYRSSLTPTDKPVNINPALRYGVLMVYKGSKSFAKVTKFMRKRMAHTMGAGGESSAGGGNRLMSGAANILGGGISGASVVWVSLEDAQRQLLHAFADETVEVVKVRYGEPASVIAGHAMHGAVHSTLSAFQLWDLGPRSIAGRVARKAGKQFVSSIVIGDPNAPGPSPNVALKGDKKTAAIAAAPEKEPDVKKSKHDK